MVQLPDTLFRAINNTRVKTSDYMVTHLDELTAYGFPACQDANNADSTLVTTRQAMYLPPRYVPLLLNASGYTIRQVWDVLYPALVNVNDLENCAALLKWLRVASTSTLPQPGTPGPSTIIMEELVVPLADDALITHQIKLLQQLLPAIYQPAETLETALTQMAVAVLQNTNDAR